MNEKEKQEKIKKLFKEAKDHFDNSRYNEAIECHTKAIGLDPKGAAAYYKRGVTYQTKGEHDKAITDYNKAIKLDPEYAAAYNNRGVTYQTKGEHDKAITDYNKAIKLDSENAAAYNNRGVFYYTKGEHNKAIIDYNEAIELDPENAKTYNNRGHTYREKGEHNKAIIDYNKAIELDSKGVVAYYNRGNIHQTKGEHDKAIVDYSRVIELDSTNAAAYNQRGFSYKAKGEYDKANADFEKAGELNPEFKKGHDFENVKKHTKKLKKLLYGFEDEYEGTKKEVRGYVELKEKFFNLSCWWFFSILLLVLLLTIVSYVCPQLSCFFDSIKYVLKKFSPFSILLLSPLPFFIHSFLKYRSLEIKIRHRISLLELKEAKMTDVHNMNDFEKKDLESIVENVNSIVFSEIESKSNNNLNFRTPFSNH